MIGVGVVETYDRVTGKGIIRSDDGRIVLIEPFVSGVPADAAGSRVVFSASTGSGSSTALHVNVARERDCETYDWPLPGDLVRLICTVSWCKRSDAQRLLTHPRITPEILVRSRHRRDLRTGDKVIAEVVRFQGYLLAIHAVRLPRDYETKAAAHASLLTPVPGENDRGPAPQWPLHTS